MNILLINPYDYKTVQSNLGLISLLQVLDKEKIEYAMTVVGPAINDGFNYIEVPESLINTETNNVDYLKPRINVNELTHIIAIDPEGAMVAMRLLEVVHKENIHCSYISYEILFGDEIAQPIEKKLKEYDLAYLGRCKEVLIQDELRGRIFCKEVGHGFEKLFYAPVSPLQYHGNNSDKPALRKKFGLPVDKRILIYSGSFSPYAKNDWWVRIAETLPENYIFLIMCYDSKQLRYPIFARIVALLSNKKNVFVIGKEFPIVEYLQLLQACDAGLALFRPIYTHWMSGKNIRQMGLSSGKFSTYISCGLPVICDSNQEQFSKLAEDYLAVQTITAPEEVASKLEKLSAIGDPNDMGCQKLFDDVLNPYNGLKSYLDELCAQS
jgi:hypothetical protein